MVPTALLETKLTTAGHAGVSLVFVLLTPMQDAATANGGPVLANGNQLTVGGTYC